MTATTLSNRRLNRATLARQMLLERSAMGIVEIVGHLLGLQGQVSEGPYQGLWSRLDGFRHEDLTALIVDRTLARATTMRATLHLHTADDLIGVRQHVQPVVERMWKSAFTKRFGPSDTAAVQRAGVALLDRQPMTAGALGKTLHEAFPQSEPLALAVLIQARETLVQIPPTRIWGSGHAPILTRVENWLPPPYERPVSREALVLRYLAAHGPASVADMQAWCGLTRLAESFRTLGDRLVRFVGEDGRELFDLPQAPRPDAETPAPVRFLPDFDNAILGYADRARMLSADAAARLLTTRTYRAILVDGFVAAHWALATRKGAATLTVLPYRRLLKREIAAVEAEADAFMRFMQPEAVSYDMRVEAADT